MSDATFLSSFVDNLNTNIFLREFSFSKLRFAPPGHQELEVADHVVRIGNLTFLYQLKERDPRGTSDVTNWFKKKILNKATRQIRDTIQLLSSNAAVLVPNNRGHIFNIALKPQDRVFRMVLFKSGGARTRLPYPRFHVSRTAGFIHIFDALDYQSICRCLFTPTEIAEYLTWRQQMLLTNTNAVSISEAALVGQYMLDNNSAPSERYAQAFTAFQDDMSSFDLSFLLGGLGDRIENAAGGDRETGYYPMLQQLAQMARSEFRLLKERLRFSIEAVNEDRLELPVRFVSPERDCGVLLLPVVSKYFPNRILALKNYCLLSKYERRVTHQIGFAISRPNKADYLIDNFYTNFTWSYDDNIESVLRERYPFRPVKAGPVARYNFFENKLQQVGLSDQERK